MAISMFYWGINGTRPPTYYVIRRQVGKKSWGFSPDHNRWWMRWLWYNVIVNAPFSTSTPNWAKKMPSHSFQALLTVPPRVRRGGWASLADWVRSASKCQLWHAQHAVYPRWWNSHARALHKRHASAAASQLRYVNNPPWNRRDRRGRAIQTASPCASNH